MKKIFAALVTLLFVTAAHAQGAGTVTNHAFALGKGPGAAGYTSLLCASAQLAVGQTAADPICRTVSGDATFSAAGALTLATVNANVGTFGSATQCVSVTYDAKGRATAASQTACTPAIGSVSGMSAGCATALITPNSANLRACFTDETGTGLIYFQGGDIGTPSAGNGSNLTALNAGNISSGTLAVARGGTGVTTTAAEQARLVVGSIYAVATAVNFNSANTDTSITVLLPTGFTNYRATAVIISGASASITTATFGLFTAAGGGGTVLVNAATAITVSTAAANTNNNMQSIGINNSVTASYNAATLFFRVGTAQGSAATATVTIILNPVS